MFDWLHQIPILSIVCYVPLAGALAVILFYKRDDGGRIRRFATWVALLDFLISLPMWWAFQRNGERVDPGSALAELEQLAVAREGVLRLHAAAPDRHAGRFHGNSCQVASGSIGSEKRTKP